MRGTALIYSDQLHQVATMATILNIRKDMTGDADKLRAIVVMLRQEKEVRCLHLQ